MPAESIPPAAQVPGSSPLAVFRHPVGVLLILVAATLAAYAPSLGGEFLWDDNYLVKGNPLIRSPLFCLEVFRHTLFNGDSNFYRPAQSLTYILDYWCWDSDPFGFHLTNALIHACNGFLLFLLLRRILPALVPNARRPATDWAALAIALLWVVHPVHNAAVAYIAGRADSLAMFFCLSAWLLCERALASTRLFSRAAWATGAFLCLLLGLCSKEIAFVWLILFWAWLFLLRPRDSFDGPSVSRVPRWNRLAVFAGGLVALGIYLFLRHLPPPSSLPPVLPVPGIPSKWLLMLRALGDYGRLMIYPDRLFMERQVFAAPGLANPAEPSFYASLAVTGGLVLAAFAVGAFLPGRGQLLRRCGAGWFLVGFLPVSNLFSLNASVAEHWLYLPSIGFLLFLVGVSLDLPWHRLPTAVRTPGVGVALLLLAAGALGVRTWLRAHDWTDSLTFYRQTIRDGGDVPRAREGLALAFNDAANRMAEEVKQAKSSLLQLGLTQVERCDRQMAVTLLAGVTARFPRAFSARVNLATIFLRLGRADEARADLSAIAADLLALTDRRAGPREFAVTIRALDRLEPPADATWTAQRRALLDRAVTRFPESWEIVQIRIADGENAHDPAGALALANDFADAHWWHAPARLAVGRLLAVLGRNDEALATWQQTARLDVYDTDALSAAARLCLEQGWLPKALALQEAAVRRKPDSLRQHLLLAQVLERLGRSTDAARERAEAGRLAESDQG